MSRPLTLLDGGTGRELHRVGAPFRQPEWSALALMEAPDAVQRVHETYLAAGADVITSNSYALTPFHIGAARFAAEGGMLADRAGRVGRAAVAEGPGRLAGSLPPVLGSYRPDLFDAATAAPLLRTLIAGLAPHVDLWLAETLSAVAEARLVRQALGAQPQPLWVSFTLQDDGDPGTAALRSGEPVALAARAALDIGAETLLFNCSQPEVMLAALTAARAEIGSAALQLGVYANAFPPQRPDAVANDGLDPIRADLDPVRYAVFAQQWRDAGADVIGGCCGIGPEHIRALADALRR